MSPRALDIAVDLALVLLAAAMGVTAASMPPGTVSLPGPGLVPLTLAVLLAVTALAHLAQIIVFGAGTSEAEAPETASDGEASPRLIAIMLGAIVGAGVLFEPAGYLLTAALFLFVMLMSLSSLGWWRAALASMGGAWVSLIVFRDVLSVTLPSGLLPF